MLTSKIQLWQEVAYSATFLRSIGWQDAGKRCGMRGFVMEFEGDLALIKWSDGYESYVNKFNLVNVDQPGGLNADVEKCKVYGYNESYKRY